MTISDELGDRMKVYEMAEAGRRLMPRLPVIARLDGRSFSAFTHGLDRPFDYRFSALMLDTAAFLCRESCATCGYTQSDEITLVWQQTHEKQEMFFDGRIAKLTSVLAGLASAYFNRGVCTYLPPAWHSRLPVFDCRVWSVPDQNEAVNTLVWRELDATKNSISMAARHYYSHNELHNKNGSEMQEMLHQKGVNWNDYPSHFKRGTYVLRRERVRAFTCEELENLPPKHEARTNPDLQVKRHDCASVDMPPLLRVPNRVAVIFENAEVEGQPSDE